MDSIDNAADVDVPANAEEVPPEDTVDENSVALPEDHAAIDPTTGDPFDYYCPGCGKGYAYPAQCVGSGATPHPAIQTVSTDELTSGDTEQHTAAPNTGF